MAESENADRVCAFDGGRRDETAGRETTHSAQTTATADNFGAAFESIFKKMHRFTSALTCVINTWSSATKRHLQILQSYCHQI